MARERERERRPREKTTRGEEKGKTAQAVPSFVRFTQSLAKPFVSFGKGAKFTPEQKDTIEFLNWPVSAEEVRAAQYGLGFIGLGVALVMILASGFVFGRGDIISAFSEPIFLLLTAAMLAIPIVMFLMFSSIPASMANGEKMLSLAYVPEIINYLVMSMRLTPNLERAVEFAAAHGRGKIADDLKRIIWEVQIGKWGSVEEALDDMAYKWGPYSDDFKHALMLIRSSVLEANPERREEFLTKAVQDVLNGSKEKMDVYARGLHQPTVYLYYFGILLPLMLAIVLPIGGAMTGMNLAKTEYIFLIYNIALPIGIYVFGRSILGSRPPTYVPPDIPADFPGLPPKGKMRIAGMTLSYTMLAIAAFAAIIIGGYAVDQAMVQGVESFRRTEVLSKSPHFLLFQKDLAEGEAADIVLKVKETDKAGNMIEKNVTGFYIGQPFIFSILIAVSVTGTVYLLGKYGARKKIQDEIREMEGEFKDAMYVLASRLGENRPIEDSLRHASEFLPRSKLANTVFKRILDNISTLGMTIDNAIFDPTFGAVKDIPSQVILSGMHILVDSVGLGVNVAARSLISLSMQIRDAQKIDEMLKRLLEDVTVMLKTMGTFIAPIVLAVVVSMQQLIVSSMVGVGGGGGSSQEQLGAVGAGSYSSSMSGAGGIGKMFQGGGAQTTDPAMFSLVMGVYVIQVVALLTYFNSQIEDSGNKLHTYTSIAYALPLAAVLFSVTAYFAATFLVTMSG
jgi:hypothetical protein